VYCIVCEVSSLACVSVWLQTKVVLEKAKQQLEAQNSEMNAELKQVSSARQEADRKRKQAEQQLQEVSVKLTELERNRGDLGDKAAKCQVPCFSLSSSYLICCCGLMEGLAGIDLTAVLTFD